MTTTEQLPAPASRHALALLRFPDQRTDWVIVTVASLIASMDVTIDLAPRIDRLHAAVPIIGARLSGETWHPGSPPDPIVVRGDPLGHPDIDRPFDLENEPPLRIVLDATGTRLAIVGHHAAFDGLALVAVLTALVGGPNPVPVASPPAGTPGSKLPLLQRLARPADRVAPTPGIWPGDRYGAAEITVQGKGVTSHIAQACVDAVSAHNDRHAAPLRKVGITVAVGGPAGVGNVASYRRIDLDRNSPVAPAVQAALASPDEPREQVSAPNFIMRSLEPVIDRFSDTILISNLGRHEVPGVTRLDFFPVARGRSAVCFGVSSIAGGATALTLRARDLSPEDTRRLLADTADRVGRPAARSAGHAVAP